MENLYDLLTKTPEGNLSAGMPPARIGVLLSINQGVD
jgi:hypothetical protein